MENLELRREVHARTCFQVVGTTWLGEYRHAIPEEEWLAATGAVPGDSAAAVGPP